MDWEVFSLLLLISIVDCAAFYRSEILLGDHNNLLRRITFLLANAGSTKAAACIAEV